ncbi:MAG TPA: (d)CMP kinase [Saprospiraceae bacterium]|nr:(d)CMP kinase [Saprospiraceae bacterium]
MIVAIDGYSSSGKSTLAKDLAKILGFIYVDTGAMYRAIALYFLTNEIDLSDEKMVQDSLHNITVSFENKDGENCVTLNGQDVSKEIRTLEVSQIVSEVAAIPAVRKKLVAIQQSLATKSLVMDGRDIGTVVFPNAEYKFFIIADVGERSRRRYVELISKGQEVSYAEVEENLKHRDHIDTTRAMSPLRQADDAVCIDTSKITREEQLEIAIKAIESKKG